MSQSNQIAVTAKYSQIGNWILVPVSYKLQLNFEFILNIKNSHAAAYLYDEAYMLFPMNCSALTFVLNVCSMTSWS